MAFTPPPKPPEFADLVGILAQSRDVNDALYQTIQVLIERLGSFSDYVNTNLTAIASGQSGGGGTTTVVGPPGPTGPQGPPGPAGGGGPHHITHEIAGNDEVTKISAKSIIADTLNDARLSPNVALDNKVNQFTVNQRISNAGGDYPRLTFTDVTQGVDAKVWQIINAGQTLNFWTLNDAESVIMVALSFDRAGQLSAYLNADQLNRGTVADARLSANVALRNANNNFTTYQQLVGGANFLFFVDNSMPVDNRVYGIANSSNYFYFGALVDDRSVFQSYMTFERAGNLTLYNGSYVTASSVIFPSVQVAQSHATSLDDYEEGTWGPVISPTGSGTITCGGVKGRYTKVGNKVTVWGYVPISATTTPLSGALFISGIPFMISPNCESAAVLLPNAATGFSDSWTYIPGNSPYFISYQAVNGGIGESAKYVVPGCDFRIFATYETTT